MQPDEILPTEPKTIEAVVGEKLSAFRGACNEQISTGTSYVREEPEKAVLFAVLAGYILRVLPIGALVRSLVGLLLFVIKPLAVFYGVAKGYEVLQRSKR